MPFRRVDDLEELGLLCTEADPTLAEIVGLAEPLTAYAWKLRYPGAEYEPEMAEAERGLAVARAVYAGVMERLPEGARVPV